MTGIKVQLIIIPNTTNTPQPVAHFIFDDSPDMETQVAATDNPNPNKKHKTALANNGSLVLSLIRLTEKTACKTGAINIIMEGIQITSM